MLMGKEIHCFSLDLPSFVIEYIFLSSLGLPVEQFVMKEKMEHRECILCGTCIDTCPRNTISYSFSSYQK